MAPVRAVPQKEHATIRERWMDTEHLVARTEARLQNVVHFADSLPKTYPNLGPEVFSAFYGCEMEYRIRALGQLCFCL